MFRRLFFVFAIISVFLVFSVILWLNLKQKPLIACPEVTPACGSSKEECLKLAENLEKQYLGCQYRQKCESCKYINWQELIPEIRNILGSQFQDVIVEEIYNLSIYKSADITGDGVPEALINLGSGGAYVNFLTLMRLEDESEKLAKPILAEFKKKDGEIGPRLFLIGASLNHELVTEMIPEKKLIYTLQRAYDEKREITECIVEAYIWNQENKIFEYSEKEKEVIENELCKI